jgi:hypothetical protein
MCGRLYQPSFPDGSINLMADGRAANPSYIVVVVVVVIGRTGGSDGWTRSGRGRIRFIRFVSFSPPPSTTTCHLHLAPLPTFAVVIKSGCGRTMRRRVDG